jgi:hypothetical protein
MEPSQIGLAHQGQSVAFLLRKALEKKVAYLTGRIRTGFRV